MVMMVSAQGWRLYSSIRKLPSLLERSALQEPGNMIQDTQNLVSLNKLASRVNQRENAKNIHILFKKY